MPDPTLLTISSADRPLIAIVGRPNVGKSTLFNRLLGGARRAVVSPVRGTTRDRLYGRVEWRGRRMTVIDTGGVELDAKETLAVTIQRQLRHALEEADGILFVCDEQEGLVPADELAMVSLRKLGKPVIVVVNKVDHPRTYGLSSGGRQRGFRQEDIPAGLHRSAAPAEFFSLGATLVLPISALHGRGVGELLDAMIDLLSVAPYQPAAPAGGASGRASPPVAIAVVGRPNVGKSSFVNAVLQQERVIVSEMPGTTRDVIDTRLEVGGQRVLLLDTAGLRARRKVKQPVDFFSMSRTLEVLRRCDVAMVLLDATEGIARDDQRIIEHAVSAGRGLVLVFNKWDLVTVNVKTPAPSAKARRAATRPPPEQRAVASAFGAPLLQISAKTGLRVRESLERALKVAQMIRNGLPDEELFQLIQRAWGAHLLPRMRGRAIQAHAAHWVAGRPVRIELAVSPIGKLPPAFIRYLLKQLYAHPQMAGVPLQLVVRKHHGATERMEREPDKTQDEGDGG